MCTTPSGAGKFLLLQTWTGKRLIIMGEGEIGDDISPFMRKLFDPGQKSQAKKATRRTK